MDPDDHEPTGAPVPEYRARRELTALETKRVISELLLRVEDHADLSTLKHGSLTAVSKLFHVSARTIKRTWQRAIEIMRTRMLLYLEHPQTRIGRLEIKSGGLMKLEKPSRLSHCINVAAFDCSVVLWMFPYRHCTV